MSQLLRRIGALATLALAFSGAHAQTYTHAVYIDRDQDAATGCVISTPSGAISGVELRLTATVSEYPARVEGLGLASCSGAGFGADAAVHGTYPVGYDLGAGDSDVIEFAVELADLAGSGNDDWTLWFLSTSVATGGTDLVGPLSAQGLGAPLVPPPNLTPAVIPATGPWALLLLSLGFGVALVWMARRHRGLLPVLLVGAALSVAGVAWAANYLLDGQIGDWDQPPLASDPVGDHTTNEPPADITTVFAAREGNRVLFRIDVVQAQLEQLIAGLLQTAFTVEENAANGTPVGELRTVTTGLGSLLQFTLQGQSPANAFAVDGAGSITVADGSALDFEATPAFVLEVDASIGGIAFLTITVQVDIGIDDAPESPLLADQALAINESSPAATVVGTITASDPDGDTLTFQLLAGNTDGAFALDASTGVLSVANAAAIIPANAPFLLTAQASDGALQATATITVTVNDLNFPPTSVDLAYATDEDTALVEPAGSLLAGITDPDADPLSVVTVPVSGPANGTLVLNADGSFSYTPGTDFNGSDAFAYTVTDGNGGSTDSTATISIAAVADAPVAVADAYNVAEGATLVQPEPGVLGNDTDADAGDTLTAVLVSGPASASSFTLNADGSFSYTHDGSEGSSDSFSYHANDGALDSSPVTVTLTITGVNDVPVAADDAYALDEGATLNVPAIGVLGNDSDPEGDALTAVLVAGPVHAASFVLNTDGSFSYQHDGSEATGSDSFTYTASDTEGATSNTATVTLAITELDDAPVAVDDAASVAEDSAATPIAVLANDTDADGGPMSIQSATQPANGTVVVAGDGLSLGYIPDADYCNDAAAPDSFTYTLAPGGSTATVAVTVTCVDDAPVAVDDAATVLEDTLANSIDVLANDTDVDAGPITVNAVTQPAMGTVAILPGGSGVSYTPNAGTCNDGVPVDSFTYSLAPGGSTATVSVTVSCIDDAPVAVGDSSTVAEDSGATAIDVLANDTDSDGGPIAVGAVTQPANGTVVITNGGLDLSYVPDADYCNDPPGGADDSFTYSLAPGASTATVAVTVTCSNDAPTLDLDADDDQGTGGSDFATVFVEGDPAVLLADPTDASITDVDNATLASLTVTLTNLLDPGEEVLSADTTGTAISASYDPITGVLALTGSDTLANYQAVLRGVLYLNASDAPDTTTRIVQFVANDGSADSNIAVASVAINEIDSAPVAVADSATVTEDAASTAIDVLANDTDADGGPISVASVTQPANGIVGITGGGTGLSYVPNPDYCNAPPGTALDTFSYTLSPGSSSATVTVQVDCVDDAPVAVADAALLVEDSGATAIDVLANDTDVDGGALSISSVTQPAGGVVVITGGGTGLTYAPSADFCNDGTPTDNFTYTLAPGGSSAVVAVTVSCVVDDPVAVADAATVLEDSGASAIDVLANDSNPDGSAIAVASVTQPSAGTVVITGGGSAVGFTPDANTCGADAFTYTLTPGGSSTTVSVQVTCVDDLPVAVADAASVLEDAAATSIDVLANDTDVDGGPMTITATTNPANGTVVVAGDGLSLTYAPDADYCNSQTGGSADSFGYTLNGGSSATVDVTVTCVNDPPVVTGTAGAAVHSHIAIDVPDGTSDLFAQFSVSDVDGPTPIVIGGSVPTTSLNGGEVVVDTATGAFTYNPPADFTGDDTFAVQFCDSEVVPACSLPQTVTLSVAGPKIWFVDDDAVVTGTRDGTLQQPFQALADATALAASGERIFLHFGNYTGGVTLLGGVDLYGQAAGTAAPTDDQFHEVLAIAPVPFGVPLPPVNGAAPVISGGTGVTVLTVTNGHTLDGFSLQTADASATALAGSGFGTVVVDEVLVTGLGRAINLSGGTLNGSFSGISSIGGSNNIALANVAGTVDLGSGALSGASGDAIAIGGSVSLTYAGTVTNTTARLLNITSHTTGMVTLSGALTQIGGSGTGLLFDNADGVYQLSGAVTLQQADAGIDVSNGSAGTITVSSPASLIANPSGIAVDISSSAPTFTYGGVLTRTNSNTTAIRASGNTGGTLTFNGPSKTFATGTAHAVNLTDNANTAVVFSGGNLAISTSTGNGLHVTGTGPAASSGGTITVTGTGNTIQASGGIAVNIANSTIGAGGVVLQRVNANGGGNGIVLNNTGTSGSLSVTGTGSAGSGGTIQNISGGDGGVQGNAVYLVRTQAPSLRWMSITNSSNNGLLGTGVRGLTLSDMLFNGNHGNTNSGAFNESAVHLRDLGGTVSFTDSTFNGGFSTAVRVENSSGTAPLLDLVIDNVTVSDMQGTTMNVGGSAILVSATDGDVDATISNSDITEWWGNAIHVLVQGAATGHANIVGNLADNTNGALAGAGGIWVAGCSMRFDISGNEVRNTNGTAISADKANCPGGTLQGVIDSNQVGVSGVANSGSGTGIGIFVAGYNGTTTVRVSNNVLRQINGSANGAITTRIGDNVAFPPPGTLNATIVGNNIQEAGTTVNNAQHGIFINHGITSSGAGDSHTGCYDVGGPGALANSITNFISGVANNRIRVQQRFTGVSRFPGYTGANNDNNALAAYLLGRNVASTTAVANNAGMGGQGFTNTIPAGSACPQPQLPPP